MRLLRDVLPLVVVAACGASGQRDVAIDQIEPASGTNAQPIPVQLTGAFSLDITSDLDNGDVGVATVDVLIDDTPLTDVIWQGTERIDATIPAGIAPGLHDIVVTIGSRRGVLAHGFAITGSALTSTLAMPALVGRGNTFVVTMDVTNAGSTAATAVAPSDLMPSGAGAATVTTPPAGGASLAAGASTTFTWTYTATTVGMLTLAGNAHATDELTGLAIESATTQATTSILEATTVVDNPLGDSSPFAYVVGYQGHVYIGPNKTGASAARLLPDGSGLENLSFTFAKDTTGGNQSSNAVNASYTSIGYTGCTPDTAICGPDNEDGRGTFASGTMNGSDWLVLGGAKASGNVEYIYMTTSTGTSLDFRYVDLGGYLGTQTHGFSAAYFLNDRLYLGFPDESGGKPYLLALNVTPTAPGLDASGPDVYNLGGDAFPNLSVTSPAMIDAFGELDGLLYLGNAGAVFGAKVATPGAYSINDWGDATPAFSPWFTKTSRPPTTSSDLLPSDRAIPQFASFGGRLFLGRNTTTGPQLWSCNPAGSADPLRCEPGDWVLVAPNNAGGRDIQLTQFNDASLTSITMVVATATHLYVGFDGASGVQVFRTSNPNASLLGDFEGTGGCDASMHPAFCQGVGGSGLGDAADTKILDGKALAFNGTSSVWITVGDATGALRLVVLP